MSEHSTATRQPDSQVSNAAEQIESSSETDLQSLPKSFLAPPPANPNDKSKGAASQIQRTANRLQQVQNTQARQAILRSMQNKHGNAYAGQIVAAIARKPAPEKSIQRCGCNKCEDCQKVARALDTTPFQFVQKAIQPQAKILRPVRTANISYTSRTQRPGRTLRHPVSVPSFLTSLRNRPQQVQARLARATARANRRLARANAKAQRIVSRPTISSVSRVIMRTVAAPVGDIGPNGEGMDGDELQELNGMGLAAEVTGVPPEAAVTGGGGGGGGAIAEQPEPPAPAVNSTDPAAAVAALSGAPASQIPAALGGVDAAAGTFVEQKTVEFQANPPQLKRPSGNGNESVSLGGKPKNEPVKKDTAVKMEKTAKGNDVPTPPPVPTPAPPPNPASAIKGKSFPKPPAVAPVSVKSSGDAAQDASAQADAQKAAEAERRRQIEQIVSQVAGAISSLPTKDSSINTKPGDPLKLKTEGNADPENTKRDQAKLEEEISKTDTQGKRDAAENMDEDKIYPTVPDETLISKPQAAESAPVQATGKAGANPVAPLPGLTPQALSAIVKQEKQSELSAALGKAQSEMAKEKQKQEQQANEEKLKGEQEINKTIQDNSQQQAKTRDAAQQDVEKQRKDWTDEQNKLVEKQRQEGAREVDKALQDVETERKKGDEQADKEFKDGERKAEEERIKGEQEAERHKKEGEAKTQDSGFFDWIADAASSFFDGIKKAIEGAFEAARKAVQAAIDAAKQLAVAAIEAARKAVVTIIQKVGDALIAIGNVLLAAFPELKERFTKLIRDAVNKATEAVNKLAEDLKAGVQKLLDLLGAAILKGLDLLKQGLLAAVSALADTVKAIINTVQAMVQVFGDLVEVISHISANPGGWIGNLGAAVKDGFINHFPKTMKVALQEWFNGKVQGLIGIEPSNFNLLTKIGLTLMNTVKTAWNVISASLPGMVVQELLTKLITMLVPAAGAIMAIIEGVQAAVSSAAQFVKGLQTFVSFLKAVRGGNAGPAFAGAMAQGVVALIEFVYNYIVSKIKTGAAKKVGDAVKKVFGKALKKVDIFKVRRQLKSAAIFADDKANQAEMTVEMKDLASGNSFAEAENAYQTALELTQKAEAAEKAAETAITLADTTGQAATTATTQAETKGQTADTAINTATQQAGTTDVAVAAANNENQAAETVASQAEAADSEATSAQQTAEAKSEQAAQNPEMADEVAAAQAVADNKSSQADAVWEQAEAKADVADNATELANTKVSEVEQSDEVALGLVDETNQAAQVAETKNSEADKAEGEADQTEQQADQTSQQAEKKTGENDGQFDKAEQLEQELQQANELAENLRGAADAADMALVAAGGKSINAKEKKPKKKKKDRRKRKPKLEKAHSPRKLKSRNKRNKGEKPKQRKHNPHKAQPVVKAHRRSRKGKPGSAPKHHQNNNPAHHSTRQPGEHQPAHHPTTQQADHTQQPGNNHNNQPQHGATNHTQHNQPQHGNATHQSGTPQGPELSPRERYKQQQRQERIDANNRADAALQAVRDRDASRQQNLQERAAREISPEKREEIKSKYPGMSEATYLGLMDEHKKRNSPLSEEDYIRAVTEFRREGLPVRSDGGRERGQLTDEQFLTMVEFAARSNKPIYLCGSLSEDNFGLHQRYADIDNQALLPSWRQAKPNAALIDEGKGDFDIWEGSHLDDMQKQDLAQKMGLLSDNPNFFERRDVLDKGYSQDENKYPHADNLGYLPGENGRRDPNVNPNPVRGGGALVIHPDGRVERIEAPWQRQDTHPHDADPPKYYRKPKTKEEKDNPVEIPYDEWRRQQEATMDKSLEKRQKHYHNDEGRNLDYTSADNLPTTTRRDQQERDLESEVDDVGGNISCSTGTQINRVLETATPTGASRLTQIARTFSKESRAEIGAGRAKLASAVKPLVSSVVSRLPELTAKSPANSSKAVRPLTQSVQRQLDVEPQILRSIETEDGRRAKASLDQVIAEMRQRYAYTNQNGEPGNLYDDMTNAIHPPSANKSGSQGRWNNGIDDARSYDTTDADGNTVTQQTSYRALVAELQQNLNQAWLDGARSTDPDTRFSPILPHGEMEAVLANTAFESHHINQDKAYVFTTDAQGRQIPVIDRNQAMALALVGNPGLAATPHNDVHYHTEEVFNQARDSDDDVIITNSDLAAGTRRGLNAVPGASEDMTNLALDAANRQRREWETAYTEQGVQHRNSAAKDDYTSLMADLADHKQRVTRETQTDRGDDTRDIRRRELRDIEAFEAALNDPSVDEAEKRRQLQTFFANEADKAEIKASRLGDASAVPNQPGRLSGRCRPQRP